MSFVKWFSPKVIMEEGANYPWHIYKSSVILITWPEEVFSQSNFNLLFPMSSYLNLQLALPGHSRQCVLYVCSVFL